jgi:GAF domain-containing protein
MDQNAEELIFEVAVGERTNLPRGTRFPISEGIAGWVVASGHAMAIADVQQNPQWIKGTEQTLGYVPKTMLAVPLLLHDEVIGVLQLMDKEDDTPFSGHDLATLGHFAQQAAVAIAQSRSFLSLSSLLHTLLTATGHQRNLDAQAAGFVADTEESAEYQDILKLARLLGEIARQSEAARRLSLRVTEAIVAYLHARPHMEKLP